MNDPSRFIKEIAVEESCVDLEYTKEILTRAQLPWRVVEDRARPLGREDDFAQHLTYGKQLLFLSRNRGIFFKPCPGTKEYRCCDYQVISSGTNCPMDCTYCILQAYLNTPWINHYVNIYGMLSELSEAFARESDSFFRVGTGEFTDSLALDRLTNLSSILVPVFAKQQNAVLELKTKSAVIDNLQQLEHGGKTIVAFSLNSRQMMATQELRAATLKQRLNAARRCAEWGYLLAFHFDPIICHHNWQNEYLATIEELFSTVPAEKIVWISLGALRYLPGLKNIAAQRFSESAIFSDDFITGLDGKMRYFRPQRVKMYKPLYEAMKIRADSRTCIYFCMESDEIWREVMGFAPSEHHGLKTMLDTAFKEISVSS